MSDDLTERMLDTIERLARRLVAAEQRLELLSGRLDTAASIDRITRRLDELEAAEAEARPPPPPLRLAAP
jgi:hypothetical protein